MLSRHVEAPRWQRRTLFLAGALAIAAALVALAVTHGSHAAAASRSNCPKHPPPFIRDSFPQPQFRTSHNGLLSTKLVADVRRTRINGKTYVSSVYDGQFPGPTLVVCPGDTMNVTLQNHLKPGDFPGFGDEAGITNLHTHGFLVSPRPPQDDVFLEVRPGSQYHFHYHLPNEERPGAYWYHPHMHTQANVQEMGGMAGAMIVQGGLDNRPAYRHIGQRVLVIQQTALGNGQTVQPGPQGPFIPKGTKFFVNGHLNPKIPIHPGEIQRWSIFNLSANSFVSLELTGHRFQLLAQDGNYLPMRQAHRVMLISPSSRREVLVSGGPRGEAKLIAAPFTQFGPGSQTNPQTLATLVSRGRKVHDRMPPKRVVSFPDLRKLKVRQRHTIVYTQKPPNFFINGKQFNPHRLDQTMTLGKVNEWTLVNKTTFWHTFHIHINDFQVIEQNGKPVRGNEQEDNVSIGPEGSIKMLTLPELYTGRFVFHCHILGHEDNGMMGTVAVVKPRRGGRG
jgi:FtsP/CotA-like multicopper oxidase with cupredoxin domain